MTGTVPIDPVEVSGWDEAHALELLDRWESAIPRRSLAEVPERQGGQAVVLGDSHADWPTTRWLAERFLLGGESVAGFFALGDFVDRTPARLPQGSLRNALFLLSLQAAHPDRVVLLRGNHETQRQIPGTMRDVLSESTELFGTPTVGDRIEDLFDRLPLAALTASGVYMAHAGFPFPSEGEWREALRAASVRTLEQVVWNDVEGSPTCGGRGILQEPIREGHLKEFLARSGSRVLLRGHDPAVAGRFFYGGRLLTIHSTRVYASAGLTLAKIPLDATVPTLTGGHLVRLPFPELPTRTS